MESTSAPKLAAFLPINTAGHTQGLLAIANQLRDSHHVRCVFIVAGPPHSRALEDHGHELIELEDLSEPYWDFEIEPGEDLSGPVSEEEEEAARLKRGEKKLQFRGAHRWPQFVSRNQSLFKESTKAGLGLMKLHEQVLKYIIENSEQIDQAIDSLRSDIVIVDNSIIHPTLLKAERTRPWIKVWSPNPFKLLLSKLPREIRPKAFAGIKLYTKQERERMRREQPELWEGILEEWEEGDVKDEALKAPWENVCNYYRDNGCSKQLERAADCNDWLLPMIYSPHLNVYMFPGAIDYDQDDDLFEYPPRWLRCDSMIRKTAGESDAAKNSDWLDRIDAKKRDQKLDSVVYFSLGSIASGEPSLVQRYIDHLSDDSSNRLYIVSKGVNGDKVQLNDRNMLGGDYLPQTLLLQHSDMAIIHGGNNSLTEALYYGKPIIVLPSLGDQPDNAQRIEDLGLGKRLNLQECTRGQLLQAVDEILADKELIANVRAIGVEMRARDDLAMVASIVMDIIEHKELRSETAEQYGIRLD